MISRPEKLVGNSGARARIFITLGGAAGPLLGGVIVDRGLGYPTVFTLFAAVLAAGAIAAFGCSPLEH